jgi:Domain of unknown function (DUF4160)
MPEISRFFGIIIRMSFLTSIILHISMRRRSIKAVFDLSGNITRGNLKSRTAINLVREWIDLHVDELLEDWDLAQAGKEIKKIDPLD